MPPGVGTSGVGVAAASGAEAGRALGSGTTDGSADVEAGAAAAAGGAVSAMAITLGRWRGSGIFPVSGGTLGKLSAEPSFEADWSGAAVAGPAPDAPFAGGIVGGLFVGLGQAKSWSDAAGAAAWAVESGVAAAAPLAGAGAGIGWAAIGWPAIGWPAMGGADAGGAAVATCGVPMAALASAGGG